MTYLLTIREPGTLLSTVLKREITEEQLTEIKIVLGVIPRVVTFDNTPVYIPPEGWSKDGDGKHRFTYHGMVPLDYQPPELEGHEVFFIAVHGASYTRWTYRPKEEQS